jgi:hypothetical protein
LVQGIGSHIRIQIRPQNVEHLVSSSGHPRLRKQEAQQGKDFPPDSRPFNLPFAGSDDNSTLVFNEDRKRESTRQVLTDLGRTPILSVILRKVTQQSNIGPFANLL